MYRISRSWIGELKLNGAADDALQLGAEPLAPRLVRRSLQRAQLGDVDGDADVLHAGEHAHERVLDRGVQLGHALLVERGARAASARWRHRERLGARARATRRSWCRRSRAGPDGSAVRGGRAGQSVYFSTQVGDRVPRLGRVDEVGGDRRVELQPGQVVRRDRAATRISALALWPRTCGWAARARAHRIVGRALGPGSTRTSAADASATTARPASALRPGSPAHAGSDVEPLERADQRRPRRPPTRRSVTSACSTSPCRRRRRRVPCRSPSASYSRSCERTELEEVEQPLDLVGLGLDRQRRRGRHSIGRVAAEHHQLVVRPDPRLVLGERRAQLRRLLVDVGEDAVEAAVGVDQLGRGLLADARHAGQVVARVAAQRRVLRVLRGRDAGLLDDAGLVVERVVADAAPVVEHLDVRIARRAGSCRGRR